MPNKFEPSLEEGEAQREQSLRSILRNFSAVQDRYSVDSIGRNIGFPTLFSHGWIEEGASTSLTDEQKTSRALEVLAEIKGAAKAFTIEEAKGTALVTEAEKYKALGLTAIAEKIESKGLKAWREFAISAAGYKRINHSELVNFETELRKISDYSSKRELCQTPLEQYVGQNRAEGDMINEQEMGLPPTDVLEKLAVAQKSKLFDYFTVLHIKYVPDPILCGHIKESKDLYFIAEWGDDIKFSDIVKE